ncbi:type IV pilin protein [Desulfotruncus alcoholivorax]|uniref:type IV pilin protein n=1 Tax=Desulfotruncus alcoholivorax TaxID=265477 RepID=UPI0003FDB878|nr:prepilin-type N-terminal cleavage/methylation domain-containing protein [Desulfotruncus alcoholivorax]
MIQRISYALKNRKGFTLVELMVVVVIIGILAAIAVPVYNSTTAKANRAAVEANLRTIDGAIMQYQANTGNTTTAPTFSGDNPDLVPNYLATWPTGPDGVIYSITTSAPFRATVTKGSNTGAWFTPTSAVSLPITW